MAIQFASQSPPFVVGGGQAPLEIATPILTCSLPPGTFTKPAQEFAKRFGTDEQILNFAADNRWLAG